ncbi:MAG: 5-formyltetrahydrofolate cyclo-ligase [Actinomycetota bacterium]
MSENPLEAKRALRSGLIAKRKAKRELDHDFTPRLIELVNSLNVKSVGCYISFGLEPKTKPFLHWAKENGIAVSCPRITSKQNLEFVAFSSETELSDLGFESPMGDALDKAPQVLFIPALAVDQSGHRLGRGGGYFDRFLENYEGLVIALVFDDEVLAELPIESHDAKVAIAVTERRIIRFALG